MDVLEMVKIYIDVVIKNNNDDRAKLNPTCNLVAGWDGETRGMQNLKELIKKWEAR